MGLNGDFQNLVEGWEREAKRGKPSIWVFTILGVAALVTGWCADNVPLMIVGLWFHLCGEATILMVSHLEKSSQLARMISSARDEARKALGAST